MIEVERRTAPGAGPPTEREEPALPLPPAVRPKRRSRWRTLLWLLVVVAVAGAGVGLFLRARAEQQSASAPPPDATLVPRLVARGQVQPIQRARVGTLSGGVVSQVNSQIGDPVSDGQEIARVRRPDGSIEVLTAPWRGTVTAMPVRLGDTVTPGTMVANVGDLSRLQIETTDLDEFLIRYVQRGQPVTATVDALDGLPLRGFVRSVSLEPQTDQDGDEHYPVTIDLANTPLELRPGMTVRVNLAPTSSGR